MPFCLGHCPCYLVGSHGRGQASTPDGESEVMWQVWSQLRPLYLSTFRRSSPPEPGVPGLLKTCCFVLGFRPVALGRASCSQSGGTGQGRVLVPGGRRPSVPLGGGA